MEQGVPEEHVLGLAPRAVYDNDVVRRRGEVRVQVLQVFGVGSGIQDEGVCVSAHGG